jgi:hypothetical protein
MNFPDIFLVPGHFGHFAALARSSGLAEKIDKIAHDEKTHDETR